LVIHNIHTFLKKYLYTFKLFGAINIFPLAHINKEKIKENLSKRALTREIVEVFIMKFPRSNAKGAL